MLFEWMQYAEEVLEEEAQVTGNQQLIGGYTAEGEKLKTLIDKTQALFCCSACGQLIGPRDDLISHAGKVLCSDACYDKLKAE